MQALPGQAGLCAPDARTGRTKRAVARVDGGVFWAAPPGGCLRSLRESSRHEGIDVSDGERHGLAAQALLHQVARAAAQVAIARKRYGSGEADVAMSLLATAFPSLVGRQGTCPWDAGAFWTEGALGLDDGGTQAAAFVLSVHNPDGMWTEPPIERPEAFRQAPWLVFDVHFALVKWDLVHRSAFSAWTADPWWP